MNGEIIEKENEWIGVEITDNNGYRHKIAVRFDGEIEGHGQDGYPDDSNERTDKGNEMVRQARDYAKWYVAQETGHNTCPWYLDCDSIETVKAAVEGCTDEELQTLFGAFHRQLAGYYDDEISQPQPDPVPDGAAMNRYREYKLDIYLTDDSGIDATSGVHTMYYAGVDDDRLVRSDDPYPDRKPDGRLEHVPLEIPWEQFETFLDYHLRCQLRDCYLARGAEPPAEYRVLGPGTDHMMVRCMHRECLPAYHEYDADVDGYRAEDTFNAGLLGPLLELF